MGSLWDDRLAEVWAPPGRAGSGVVVGAFGVLTARHVVANVLDGSAAGGALARVIRRGAPPAWVPMRVAAHAAEWDLAMLEVDRDLPQAAAWVPPASPSPVMVTVDAGSVEGCEAVGFPSEEVQQRDGAGPAEVVRQSEQLRGTLLPKGQAKPPVAPRPGLPREWMPLDASTTAPGEQAGWRGMSGAGVLLPDGRLTAVVVAAESGHQQRRLYVVPLAPALATAPDLVAALATVTGAAVVVEAQPAPAYRRVLSSKSLRADGTPLQLGEVADLGVFGVKPVDLAGEPTYLNYVPRDDDGRLGEALREAAAARQALLLVGDSGSGKTRSAAQAARDTYGTHRLLRPAEHQLAQLPDLPLAGLGPALVWLDDVENMPTRHCGRSCNECSTPAWSSSVLSGAKNSRHSPSPGRSATRPERRSPTSASYSAWTGNANGRNPSGTGPPSTSTARSLGRPSALVYRWACGRSLDRDCSRSSTTPAATRITRAGSSWCARCSTGTAPA